MTIEGNAFEGTAVTVLSTGFYPKLAPIGYTYYVWLNYELAPTYQTEGQKQIAFSLPAGTLVDRCMTPDQNITYDYDAPSATLTVTTAANAGSVYLSLRGSKVTKGAVSALLDNGAVAGLADSRPVAVDNIHLEIGQGVDLSQRKAVRRGPGGALRAVHALPRRRGAERVRPDQQRHNGI